MKARPIINRTSYLRASARHRSSVNVCFPYRSPQNLCWDRNFQSRKLSTSHPSYRFSLTDHIKQFIPKNAIEEEESLVDDDVPLTRLAAFEAEVSTAERLIRQYRLKDAIVVLLNSLPLDALLVAFKSRLMPIAKNSSVGLLGVLEIAFTIYKQGNDALAQQVLAEFDYSVSENSRYFAFVAGLESNNGDLKSTEMDTYLRTLLDRSTALNFPQMFSNKAVSAWLKAHLLAQLSQSDLQRWLTKYSSHFSEECICLLAMLCSTLQFRIMCDWLVKESPDLIPPVVKMIVSKEKFRIISRKLLRRSSDPDTAAAVAESMLESAIRLKQTYDIANICRRFSSSLQRPETKPLLVKALLAAAFAQLKPECENELHDLVSGSNDELHTYLVERVLSPVSSDEAARNIIIAKAAQRLHALYAKKIPGKVLWQLLLSLPGPLIGPANASLARLIIQRPYLEQIRYMSLPITTSGSIFHLLRWHIAKTVDHRKINVIAPAILQAKEDIELLLFGMLLASEKQKLERKDQPELCSMVIRDHSGRTFATSIVYKVVAELIKQKQYTITKQLLSEIGLDCIPASIYNNIMLNLAVHQPEDSYRFVAWLVLTNGIFLSSKHINKMMRILVDSNLTESQLVNRFQSLRRLLIISLRAPFEASTASCLVNALIKSALTRSRGSHQRLKWALKMAKQARVPESEFTEWNAILTKMREQCRGFWASSI